MEMEHDKIVDQKLTLKVNNSKSCQGLAYFLCMKQPNICRSCCQHVDYLVNSISSADLEFGVEESVWHLFASCIFFVVN